MNRYGNDPEPRQEATQRSARPPWGMSAAASGAIVMEATRDAAGPVSRLSGQGLPRQPLPRRRSEMPHSEESEARNIDRASRKPIAAAPPSWHAPAARGLRLLPFCSRDGVRWGSSGLLYSRIADPCCPTGCCPARTELKSTCSPHGTVLLSWLQFSFEGCEHHQQCPTSW